MKKKNSKVRAEKGRKQDPHAEREASQYEQPIASREFIMELLDEAGVPLRREKIAEMLQLTSEDTLEGLRRRLNAMERDAQVIRNRRNEYALLDKMDLISGRVLGHADGFGFLVPDEGGDDLFLSPRQMRGVFPEDRVVAHVVGVDRRGRREGAIVEVIERNTHHVVGRFNVEGGVGFVIPDNKRIIHDIVVPKDFQGDAEHGHIVSVEIIEQPGKRNRPVAKVDRILGEHMAPGMEIDIAILRHELPGSWSAAVDDEMACFSAEVPEDAKQGRLDLRDTPLVTIDGADSRDFDDAVFCEKTPKGWRLLVAIADVSHYVATDTALDKEAYTRGNSVYFPERVIPMFPEALSNGLCSLNPDVDRLCMVCEMYVNKAGKMTRSSFKEGVMRSHARLTYDAVAAMLVDGDTALREQHADLLPHLEELYRLYKALHESRGERGAIDFDTTETRIVFCDDRKIDSIVPVHRNDAHKLIEECMILANVAAARFLERHKIPTLYRVHEQPKLEKLIDLREFLSELGLGLGGGDKPGGKDYATILSSIKDRPDYHLIQTVLLRSMNRAKYHPDNVGHFGLSQDQYLHFTSPIRRYADLLVHRGIRHVLRGGKKEDFKPGTAMMLSTGEHISMTERRADEATRDVDDWLKCEYMSDKVGEVYEGIITSVTSFGIFVELQNIYVEGLVHITALRNDFYHFDPVGHRLSGERSGKVYRLGDRVEVRVVRVNLDDRKIDFEPSDQEPGAAGGARKGKRPGNKKDKGRRRSGGKPEQVDEASSEKKGKKRKPRRRKPKSRQAEDNPANGNVAKTDTNESESSGNQATTVKKKRRRRHRKPKAAAE
ncbi:MAG: ribonuclease R [Gammaproteobacteria bacterium]|nr:ribonuclease R [Gammaproteobacteria bacterium]